MSRQLHLTLYDRKGVADRYVLVCNDCVAVPEHDLVITRRKEHERISSDGIRFEGSNRHWFIWMSDVGSDHVSISEKSHVHSERLSLVGSDFSNEHEVATWRRYCRRSWPVPAPGQTTHGLYCRNTRSRRSRRFLDGG